MKKFFSPLAFTAWIMTAFAASAQAPDTGYEGMAKPWQLGFQKPVTPVMEQLVQMHHYLLVLITVITLFVLAIMGFIILRFNRKSNPTPSKTTHNTQLEVIWTIIPVIILVVIAIPSLRLHYFMEKHEQIDMTLKVTGYQWYWHYDYPDQGGFGFDSYIKKDKDLLPGEHRLMAVDNAAVVPVDTAVRVEMTGADVIHSWSVPAFGVKRDAVPGRLNESWFKADKIGTFYGQCSQLCGVGHGFMPIVVKVVSKDDFAAWVKDQQAKAGVSPTAATNTATITQPVSAVHPNPTPVINKEKASGVQQPAPAKAAGDTNNPQPNAIVPAHPKVNMAPKAKSANPEDKAINDENKSTDEGQ